MFINRIEIKNFKVIREISINLDANKNNIEKDVKLDRFKILDGTKPISGITALVGRNSVGKSTIIKALSFITDVETGLINQEITNNFIKEEIKILQNKTFLRRPNFEKDMFIEFNKIASKKSREISKKIEEKKGLDFQKYILKSTEWFYNFFEHNNNGQKDEPISFTISFCGKNNKFGKYNICLNNEGNITRKIEGDFKLQQYQYYFRNVFAPTREYDFEFKTPNFFNARRVSSSYHNFNEVEMVLSNMIATVGEESTTKILKLCDEDIVGIKHFSNRNNSTIQIKNIAVKNGSISPEDLSSGTKRFIVLVEAIVRAFKNKKKYGLILLDKVGINLHNQLIQALFQMLINLFRDLDIQSILTTHNLISLKPLLSNKQIFSIDKNNQMHDIIKASKIMKPHENIKTKQEQGLFAYYQDKELIRNTIADFICEIRSN